MTTDVCDFHCGGRDLRRNVDPVTKSELEMFDALHTHVKPRTGKGNGGVGVIDWRLSHLLPVLAASGRTPPKQHTLLLD